jgi:hypothetical protein
MRQTRCLIFAMTGILGVVAAQAADLKVIANPSLTASSVSAAELKAVFLMTKTSLNGSRVEPVLEKGGTTHDAFLTRYLGKTDAALGIYYRSLVFTGKAFMPKTLESDAEVAEYVAKTKGAVGYVKSDTGAPGAKEITVK